jgi:glycosyltransferase involved in cell wall biosynthesis
MTRRVRVLSVIGDLGFGGGENRLLSLAKHIDSSRFEHKVLTLLRPDPRNEESWEMHRHFREAGVPVMHIAEERAASGTQPRAWDKAAGVIRRVRKLRRVIHVLDADVVDAHLEAAALAGVAAARTAGRRAAVTLYHARPLAPAPFWTAAAKITLGAADAVITDSSVRSKEISAFISGSQPKMLVIPNGIDPPAARRPAAEARALLGLPLDPGVRIVGQVSGLVQFKGHLVLLEAAKRVLEAQPNTAFLFVGYVKRDQEYVQRLERKAAELGLSGRVRIAPYPGAIGDVWNIIDVHVHASLFDSLPNAIIEGMSLGKPAVVTNVGGVPEMVEDGRTGLVVPVNDPVALARALVELLERPGLAVRLGRAAREKYIERCRPDVMARQLEECFLQLARRRLQTTTS